MITMNTAIDTFGESNKTLNKFLSTGNWCKTDIPKSSQHENYDLSTLRYYFDGIFSLVVITLGLIGNFLTIVVLTRKMMHSSTNFYLASLAVWDSLVLIITFFLITLPNILPKFGSLFPYVVVYVYPVGLIAQTATIWLTLSFTVERYIAVCHPLRAASMCTIERARHVITGVCIASVLYNVIRWFDYEIDFTCNNRTGEMTQVTYRPTHFSANEIYQNVYYAWLYPLMMSLIPLVALMILNTFLIFAVRRSSKQRNNMNVRQSRENNVTIMLVTVVIVFIICQIPAMVYNVAQAYIDIKGKFWWETLSIIRNFLVNLNSAVNFMLYCILGQKFRRIFIQMFCKCFDCEDDQTSLGYHAMTAVNTSLKSSSLKGEYANRTDSQKTSSKMSSHYTGKSQNKPQRLSENTDSGNKSVNGKINDSRPLQNANILKSKTSEEYFNKIS